MSEQQHELTHETIPVSIRLLNDEYSMRCDVNDRLLFEKAGQEFDRILRSLSNENAERSKEQLLILAGLNMTFTLLKERRAVEEEILTANRICEHLGSNLDQTINDF
ncbi:MAG: cell division protein ZapA [Cardiobacteriaceae bacterium]|nr:cell division protein ZapA [Cardiobacteriaceae bacterium]